MAIIYNILVLLIMITTVYRYSIYYYVEIYFKNLHNTIVQ